jgi:hypothetical protein
MKYSHYLFLLFSFPVFSQNMQNISIEVIRTELNNGTFTIDYEIRNRGENELFYDSLMNSSIAVFD